MAVWVAVGGRGTLVGAAVGAFAVSWFKSVLTGSTTFSAMWPYFLGGLFVVVVMFLPEGLVGIPRRLLGLYARVRRSSTTADDIAPVPTSTDGEG